MIFIQDNAFRNAVSEMASILFGTPENMCVTTVLAIWCELIVA